jgi:hypothetical protein
VIFVPPRKRTTPTAKVDPVKVDDTVKNQESPGAVEPVDRNPEAQIVEDNGAQFDISKPYPELIDPDAEETEARRARLRQTDGAMNAKDLVESDEKEDEDKVVLEFVESGLTAEGRVWKKGQIFEIPEGSRNRNTDSEGNVWYDLTAAQQKDRYGKVFFEKR